MEARDKPFDVFISHSSADRHAASLIKQHLQSQGLRCWKAPDDILPGESWPQAILRAIGNSEVMLLVWTSNATTSQEVGKELTLAMRNNLTVVPFRLENVAAAGEWEYHLANTHWMDAFDGRLEDHLGSLATYLRRVVAARAPRESNSAANTSNHQTAAEAAAAAASYKEILSPMVGTFYSAPSPESPPFVKVGQKVTPDTVVCIIEAMRLMYEINAEVSGTITEVAAENGQSVQLGQALFRYKSAKPVEKAKNGRTLQTISSTLSIDHQSLAGAHPRSSSSTESFDMDQAPWWAALVGIFLSAIVTLETGAHSLPVWVLGPMVVALFLVFTYATMKFANFLKANQ